MSKIKFIFLAFFIAEVFANDSHRENMKKYMKIIKECGKEVNADKEAIRHMLFKQIPATKEEGCLFNCVYKKLGLIENNKLHLENLDAVLKSASEMLSDKIDEIKKIYISCFKTDSDECTTAKNFATCLFPKKAMLLLDDEERKIYTECKTKTSASEVDMYYNILSLPPKTKESSCLYACVFKEKGIMASDNTIVVEKRKALLKKIFKDNEKILTAFNQAIDKCKEEEKHESDECSAAEKHVACISIKLKQMHQKHKQT